MNRKWTIRELTTGAMFVALTAIGTNITSIIPFLNIGGVPITLQTFFAVLAGLVLGSRLGAFTMFAYMMLGLVGAPIFAQFKGGPAAVLSPTFGFIVSFILVAYIAGKLVEKRKGISIYMISAFIATAINYLLGTNWMYMAYMFWFDAPSDFSYTLAWIWMLPPLPKDIILSFVAGALAFQLHKAGITHQKKTKEKKKIA